MEQEMYSCEPNLIAEDYRNRAVSITRRIENHLDFIDFSIDGTLLLGTSNLTGRNWTGSTWIFQDPHVAPDVKNCLAGVEFESGVTDGKFMENKSKIMISEDSGALHILALNEVTDNKTFYFTTVGVSCEHDDSILCLETLDGKKRALTGGMDMSIKIWDICSLTVEKSYVPAHSHHVTSLAPHSADNNLFISTSLDGLSLSWDIRLEKPASLLCANDVGYTSSCWISENGVAVGSSSGYVSLIDNRTKKELDRNYCSKRGVHYLRYNEATNCIAVAVDDSVLQVLLCKDDLLQNIYKSEKHEDFVRGLAWEPTTNVLFSCGWDKKVFSHNIPLNSISMDLNGKSSLNEEVK